MIQRHERKKCLAKPYLKNQKVMLPDLQEIINHETIEDVTTDETIEETIENQEKTEKILKSIFKF